MDKYREEGEEKGLCVRVCVQFIVCVRVSFRVDPFSHPMVLLLVGSIIQQQKRENAAADSPPNTRLGQLAYCKIEVTEPPAGKVDPPLLSTTVLLLVWSYVCICSFWLRKHVCVEKERRAGYNPLSLSLFLTCSVCVYNDYFLL